jgi:hypothetical protein
MRLNGVAPGALYRFLLSGRGNREAIRWSSSAMTASNGDQCISRNSADSLPERPEADALAIKDHLTVNATVTYAPLAVWKDFHWTCTVTKLRFAGAEPIRVSLR